MSTTSSHSSFLASLRHALLQALQWRLLLLGLLLVWIPTLLVALPVWRILAVELDHAVHASDWAQRFDPLMWSELARSFNFNGPALGSGAVLALVLTLLLIPFNNAMGIAASRDARGLGFGELLRGGLRHYGAMLRLLLWSLIPVAAIAALAGMALHAVADFGAHAILESDVTLRRWLVLGVTALLLLLWHACMEAGRGWLAFAVRRHSALGALVQGVKLVLARPGRSLGLYLTITLKALVLLAVLGLLRTHLSAFTVPGFLAGLLLTQLLSLVTHWAAYARLFAMRELTAEQHAGTLA